MKINTLDKRRKFMTDALVIDAEGLDRLSCNAKANPETGKKTLKAKTVCETGFRNMTYVRDLAPMLVGEPPALLGDDSAPNPSETRWSICSRPQRHSASPLRTDCSRERHPGLPGWRRLSRMRPVAAASTSLPPLSTAVTG